jgi:hypothetical protein
VDGSATVADGDYRPVHGLLLTFAPGGPLQQQVTVLVNGDPAHEPDENFWLYLTSVSGGRSSATSGWARSWITTRKR